MAAFKAELQTVNWDDVTGHNDPNSAYETFLSKYIASYNKCFPLKKVKARNGHLNKSCMVVQGSSQIHKKEKHFI